MSFQCPDCKRVSHHAQDEKEQYCAACCQFFDEESLRAREAWKARNREEAERLKDEIECIDIQLGQFKRELEPIQNQAESLKEKLAELTDEIDERKHEMAKLSLEQARLEKRMREIPK